MTVTDMLKPSFVCMGAEVWYEPSPGVRFAGVVDSEPVLLGGHTLVVHLRDMHPAYAKWRKTPGRTTVKAAAVDRLAPRSLPERTEQS